MALCCGGSLWGRVEGGLERTGLRAERLSVHRAGTPGGLGRRTREGPRGEDGPQGSSGEAARTAASM